MEMRELAARLTRFQLQVTFNRTRLLGHHLQIGLKTDGGIDNAPQRQGLDQLSAVLNLQSALVGIEMERHRCPEGGPHAIGVFIDHHRAIGSDPAAENTTMVELQPASRVNQLRDRG